MLQRAEDPLALRSGLFADQLAGLEDENDVDDLESWGVTIRRSTKVTPLYRPTALE